MLKEYFAVSDIVDLKIEGFNKPDRIHGLAISENWLFQVTRLSHSDKPVKEYHISNFQAPVREKIVNKLLEKQRLESKVANLSAIEKIEREAYARFEIIHYVISNRQIKIIL